MPPDLKPKRRSGNISKSFITASGAIRALAIWHRPCLRKNSANNRLVVEVGVSTIVRTGQCIYNRERPHLSLGMKTPDEVHRASLGALRLPQKFVKTSVNVC